MPMLHLPLLVKIGLVHAQFETIHPFLDGNGRVGRLLITFLLCGQKVLLKPVLYLSYFFKQHRQQYYEELPIGTRQWDLGAVAYFFSAGHCGGERTGRLTRPGAYLLCAKNIVVSSPRTLAGPPGNGHRVLEYIYRHPDCFGRWTYRA